MGEDSDIDSPIGYWVQQVRVDDEAFVVKVLRMPRQGQDGCDHPEDWASTTNKDPTS